VTSNITNIISQISYAINTFFTVSFLTELINCVGITQHCSFNAKYFYFTCFRDAIVVTIANCLTSFFAGFIIFAIIGFLAKQLNMEVDNVAVEGN